jgi:hypothetical protein
VHQENIIVILNMVTPNSFMEIHATLVHTGYYIQLSQFYAKIVVLIEKLLCKDTKYLLT